MEDLDIQIKLLQQTIQVMVKQYKQLQKENELLKTTNQKLNENLLQKETLLENELHKKSAQGLVLLHNDEERKILQQKIDSYLRDIEKCLSLLNA